MKRISVFLIILAIVSTLFSVTVLASDAENYEYYPHDIIVVGLNDGTIPNSSFYGVSLSWKNPYSEWLSEVSVYSVNESTMAETYLGSIESPEPGKVSSIEDQTKTKYYDFCFYRLLFRFSNGVKKDVYYRGRYICEASFTTFPGITGITGYYGAYDKKNPEVYAEVTNTVSSSGNNSLRITSNLEEGSQKYYRMYFNKFKTNLGNGKDYTFSMNVKTKEATSVDMYNAGTINCGTLDIPDTNDEWQVVTFDFTSTKSSSYFEFRINQATETFYVDDVKIVDAATGNTIVLDQNFDENGTYSYSAPENITVKEGGGSAVFSWTNVGTNTRYISVYEKMDDGTLVLIARMPHTSTGVTIKNLLIGQEYTFVLSGRIIQGLEAFSDEFTVTPIEPILGRYDYEPGNMMVTGYNAKATAPFARLSWKNPLSDSLSLIKVYSIKEDGEEVLLQTINHPVPGEIQYVDEVQNGKISDSPSGIATFRTIYEFDDGEITKEVYYSGKWQANKAVAIPAIGLTIQPIANDGTADLEAQVSATREAAYSGEHSFKIESNISNVTTNRYLLLYSATNKLTPNAKYTGTFRVKTLDSAKINVGGNTTPVINLSGDNDWQEISVPEYSDANGRYWICVRSSSREIYIDDIELTAVDPATEIQTFTEDFENSNLDGGLEAPQNVTAEAGAGYVKLSWDPVKSGGYIRIFEEIDGKNLLRANVVKSENSVTLSNLTNDVEHKFVLKTYSNSVTSESASSTEIYATPIAPEYETKKPLLYCNGNEVNSLSDGVYSAKAYIRNNKLDEGIKAQAIVAVYDGYELLKAYASDARYIDIGTKYSVFDIDNIVLDDSANKEYTVRVMLWGQLSKVNPIIESSVYTEN